MFLLRLSFLNASWFFSLRNLSLSKVGEGEEVKVLLALVFLGMILRKGQEKQKRTKKKQEKPRADCKLAQNIYIYIEITIYMMHEQINVMMHALMQ